MRLRSLSPGAPWSLVSCPCVVHRTFDLHLATLRLLPLRSPFFMLTSGPFHFTIAWSRWPLRLCASHICLSRLPTPVSKLACGHPCMRATPCHNNRDQTRNPKNETTPTFVTTTPAKRMPSHDLKPLPPIIRKGSDDNTTNNSNANDDSMNEVLVTSERPCPPELMGVFGTRFANPTKTASKPFRGASATKGNNWIPMGVATNDSTQG